MNNLIIIAIFSILIFVFLLFCTKNCNNNPEKYMNDYTYEPYYQLPYQLYYQLPYQLWNISTRSTRNMSYDIRGDPPNIPFYIPLSDVII